MIAKLSIKASMDGTICFSASQNSAVELISVVRGILISMISKVKAMAKTPSLKASRRAVGFFSDIVWFDFGLSVQVVLLVNHCSQHPGLSMAGSLNRLPEPLRIKDTKVENIF